MHAPHLGRVPPLPAPEAALAPLAGAPARVLALVAGPGLALPPDQPRRDARLGVAVVVADVVGAVAPVARDFAGVELAAPAVVGLDLVALAEGPRAAAAPALAAAARRDARLAVAVVVLHVHRAVAVDAGDAGRVVLPLAAVVGLDLVALAEAVVAAARAGPRRRHRGARGPVATAEFSRPAGSRRSRFPCAQRPRQPRRIARLAALLLFEQPPRGSLARRPVRCSCVARCFGAVERRLHAPCGRTVEI